VLVIGVPAKIAISTFIGAAALVLLPAAQAAEISGAGATNYVPMPDPVVKLVEVAWKTQLTGSDGKPVWSGQSS